MLSDFKPIRSDIESYTYNFYPSSLSNLDNDPGVEALLPQKVGG